MRCGRARRLVLEENGGRSARLEEHLSACPACAAYAQGWARLQSGLRQMARLAPPEPSLGFAVRVIRNLQDASGAQRAEFFLERAGRRFIYAALLATLLLFGVLTVPRSSPVRSTAAAAEIEAAQPETVAEQNYPIYSGQLMDSDFEFAPQSGSH